MRILCNCIVCGNDCPLHKTLHEHNARYHYAILNGRKELGFDVNALPPGLRDSIYTLIARTCGEKNNGR